MNVTLNNDAMRATIQSAMSKANKGRKEKRQLYQDIDGDYFSKNKPTNPLEFIDTSN